MRTQQEIMDLVIGVAEADERIIAVSMEGSRANPDISKDIYQDFDISYYTADISPFYNNPDWVTECFGKPAIMQMPETMRNPDGNGIFTYLMLFADGIRIDLGIKPEGFSSADEPSVILLEKTPIINKTLYDNSIWQIQKPSPLFYYSCCNNFWWCLNNLAKGIARDELPYVMNMLNNVIRRELHDMIEWYIGVKHGFNLSTGKDGKYYRRCLEPDIYKRYLATYPSADYKAIWNAVYTMCDLFHTLAAAVAASFGFSYRQDEEDAIRGYLKQIM